MAGLSSGGDDCVWTIHLTYFYETTNLKSEMYILKIGSTNWSLVYLLNTYTVPDVTEHQ